jgi:hypothetical protein
MADSLNAREQNILRRRMRAFCVVSDSLSRHDCTGGISRRAISGARHDLGPEA